jgi:hypothetical protein
MEGVRRLRACLFCGDSSCLVEGHTLGGGHKPSRNKQLLSFCRSNWWRFGTAYKQRFACKGFSNSQEKIKGASVQWKRQQRKGGGLV